MDRAARSEYFSTAQRIKVNYMPNGSQGSELESNELMTQVIAIGEFSGELNGRDGHILYREAANEIPIYWELSIHKELDGSRSYGVSVTCDFQYWARPKGEPISEKHQLRILAALREWLHTHGTRSTIDLPKDLSEDPDKCLCRDCHRRRIKGIYYCRHHFDLSCLVNIL